MANTQESAAGAIGDLGRRVNDASRWWRRVAIAGVVAFAALRLATLTHYPPWTDETWTFGILPENFRRLIRWFADDQTHPPLFYILLWCWARVTGMSLFALRLFPSLIGCLTAIPLVALCRAAKLDRAATALAVAITALMPVLVAYSNEVRSYSLLIFLTTASLALWLRSKERAAAPGAMRDLTIVNVLLVYTHFFGVLVVCAEWCDSLRRPRGSSRAMTVSSAVTAASLLPWGAYVLHRAGITQHQLHVVDWIGRPQISDLIEPYAWLLGGSPWYAMDLGVTVAVGGMIAYWLLNKRGSAAGDAGITLLIAAVVPVIVTLLFSTYAGRSAWVLRYMLVIATPFAVLVAAAAGSVFADGKSFKILVPYVLSCWIAFTSFKWMQLDQEKVHFERLAQAITANGRDSALVYYSTEGTEGGPMLWIARAKSLPIQGHVVASFDSVNADHGWVVSGQTNPPHGPPPAAVLIRRGYTIGTPVFELGMHDSVVALPFSRKSH